jgi:MazG family protein
MAKEEGSFDFDAVVSAICEKMERRHPHVFGDKTIADAQAQTVQWEAQKAQERRQKAGDRPPSALEGVSTALPAQTRALKLQARAGRVGFDWPDAIQVLDKIAEEIDEVRAELGDNIDQDRLEDEMGDLLFACVNLARKFKIDPETALRRGNRKFERRFHYIESELAKRGRTPGESTLDEMEALWIAAKSLE